MSVISAAQFKAALDKWGVNYVEHSRYDRCLKRTVSWAEHEARRGRDCARRGWDARGVAIHHSGGPTSWEFVWDGRSDVPGPLYTAIIYPDGVAHLTGFRITNNVGRCDATVRNRAVAGKMPTTGGNVTPGADDYYAANSEFYGISYRGTAPNAAQRRTALLMTCAICDAHGDTWDGGSVAGHKELTLRKPDPEGENMSDFRADVNATLKKGPVMGEIEYKAVFREDGWMRNFRNPDSTNTTIMAETGVEWIGDAVWRRMPTEGGSVDTLTPRSMWKWAYVHSRRNAEELARLTEQVAGVHAKLAALASAVEQLSNGAVDMTAVQQAAMAGAHEALATVNIVVSFPEHDEPVEG